MIKVRENEDWNKVNTKEELKELLDKYSGILNPQVLEYLKSLVNLKFSVIKDEISEKDRLALSDLELYKRIAIYNIYKRASQLFRPYKSELKIEGNRNGLEGLRVYAPIGEKQVCLFDFDYAENAFNKAAIGTISLYKTVKDRTTLEEAINQLMVKLANLRRTENPYKDRPKAFDGPASRWAYSHSEEIRNNENRLRFLESKRELSEEDKIEIEATQKFYEMMMEDYGYKGEEFIADSHPTQLFYTDDKLLPHKARVKQLPNLKVNSIITYI